MRAFHGAAFCAAAVCAAAHCAGGPRIEKIAEYPLALDGAGGIAFLGGERYWILRDHDARGRACMHEMRIAVDRRTGGAKLGEAGPAVELEGNSDSEGLAYDAKTGLLWASDEILPSVKAFGFGGKPTGAELELPERQRRELVPNRSLEGLTICGDCMWTANEEALKCDASPNDPVKGCAVRLMRYRRSGAGGWRADGEWAYRCDPPGLPAGKWFSGVSGLCALPGGGLLVLEREASALTFGRCRIYAVGAEEFAEGRDVSAKGSIAAGVEPVAKKGPLFETRGKGPGGALLYEGICLGPELEDGSRALLMVSDGGEVQRAFGLTLRTVSRLCVLRLRF